MQSSTPCRTKLGRNWARFGQPAWDRQAGFPASPGATYKTSSRRSSAKDHVSRETLECGGYPFHVKLTLPHHSSRSVSSCKAPFRFSSLDTPQSSQPKSRAAQLTHQSKVHSVEDAARPLCYVRLNDKTLLVIAQKTQSPIFVRPQARFPPRKAVFGSAY